MDQRVKPQGCVLQSTAISGRLQGLLGEIAIAQTYQNAAAANIEAVFTFPVPAEAVLLGVEIRIDDRVLQGRVLPKRQAEDAVVLALLHAILRHETGCRLPRDASRTIRSRFQQQVSATLAAVVEPLVETWCFSFDGFDDDIPFKRI